MKTLVIVGAGTAGTTLANRMVRRLPDWLITVVEPTFEHLFQPDLLFLPFSSNGEQKLLRPREHTLDGGLEWIATPVARVEPERKRIQLEDRVMLDYDLLVIASGCQPRFEATPGLDRASAPSNERWHRRIHDFYTMQGALELRHALSRLDRGRLVVHLADTPTKYSPAALEFVFLADTYLRRRGLRQSVELSLVTPDDRVFHRPRAARELRAMLAHKGIDVVTGFHTTAVEDRVICARDERQEPYDLLVTIPAHGGASFVARSGLGDARDFIPTDMRTLRAIGHDDIYVAGDAAALPICKAGSAAHFQSDVLAANLARVARGHEPHLTYDGHANCIVETGHGKAMVIDYSYDVDPLPGRFGPFSLLEQSRINHAGKLAARWLYWNRLLPGKSLFMAPHLSMRGKRDGKLAAA